MLLYVPKILSSKIKAAFLGAARWVNRLVRSRAQSAMEGLTVSAMLERQDSVML